MGLLESFAKQFKKPEGFSGRVAGYLMSKGAKKSVWTVSLLNPDKDDSVLEVGFGPGMALEELTRTVTDGYIAGIDISDVMLEEAAKRNREAVRKGLVDLKLANVSHLPSFEKKFDHILSVNNFMFWEHPVQALKNLRNITKRNGKIAVTVQPLMKGADDNTVKEFGQRITESLKEAGYSGTQIHIRPMKPVAAVCVTAINRLEE